MLRGDDPRIGLALFEDTVLIDGGVLAISYTNDVDPFAGLDRFLEKLPTPLWPSRSKHRN